MRPKSYHGFRWQPLQEPEFKELALQAKRYCPEFPFEPVRAEKAVTRLPLYNDYRLMRLFGAEGQQVWGFYAPGDFHPIDNSGRTFEELNESGPLGLTLRTLLAYALLRLRFELPVKCANGQGSNEIRLARIVSSIADLPAEKLRDKELAKRLRKPTIEMAPHWKLSKPADNDSPADITHGRSFYVVAFAIVYHGATKCELIQAFIQVEPDGAFTIRPIDKKRRSGKVRCEQELAADSLILTTHRTRTATPIKEWRVLMGDEAKPILAMLEKLDLAILKRGKSILRLANLPFYPNYELLEILVSNAAGYRRTYSLVKTDMSELRPLVGAAGVIHGLNSDKDQLRLNKDTVESYLRFFCWATHNNGPFYVPSTMREIPFLLAPTPDQQNQLRKIDFKVSPLDELAAKARGFEVPPAGFVLTAYIAYVEAVFQAWFLVKDTGHVEILEDEPRVADLMLDKEKYGDDISALFQLIGPKTSTSETLMRVLIHDQLRKIRKHWSGLNPDQEVLSTDALVVEQPLREVLEPEQGLDNVALQFLHAHVTGSAQVQQSKPAILLESLELLFAQIMPELQISAEGFLQLLAKKGHVLSRLVMGELLLNQRSVHSNPNESEDVDLETHASIVIANCWFRDQVRLRRLTNSPPLIFRQCVFEKGVLAMGAEIGDDLRFVECVFRKDVDQPQALIVLHMENARIAGDLILERCNLEGSFYAPRLRANNHVGLRGCGISEKLTYLRRAMSVKEMQRRPWPEPEGEFASEFQSDLSAIVLSGARIEGNLRISALSEDNDAEASMIYGSILGVDISVGHNLYLSRTSCSKTVLFSGAQIFKNAYLGFLRTLQGDVNFSNSVVGRALDLSAASINGEVELYQITIASNLGLVGLKTTGNLDLAFSSIQGFVFSYHTYHEQRLSCLSIGGNLVLSGANAKAVELRGAEIVGKIQIITGKFGRLIMALGASMAGLDNEELAHNYGGSFTPLPCRASAVEITSIVVDENLDLAGLSVRLPEDQRKTNLLRMNSEGAVFLVNSRIGRDLTFFRERVRLSLESRWKANSNQRLHWQKIPTPQEHGATIWGNLILRGNEIGGELDLRHLTVEGDINLNDTRVRFDLNIDGGDPNFDGFETTCTNVNAEKLECSGDVMLSGLNVRKNFRARQSQVKGEIVFLPQQIKERLSRDETAEVESIKTAMIRGDLDLSAVDVRGDLDLRNLNVAGNILIYDTSVGVDLNMDGSSFPNFATLCNTVNADGLKCTGEVKLSGLQARGDFHGRNLDVGSEISFLVPDRRDEYRLASVGGILDLSAARANRLTISGKNFRQELSSNRKQDARVILERAQVGHLEIMKPPVLGPVNLSGISVSHWAFRSSNPNLNSDIVQDYIDVLDGLTPFDSSTWLDIERLLRNQSEVSEANRIYRQMRKRIRNDKSMPTVKLFCWRCGDVLKSISIGYGTQVWIPMVLGLLLLVLSVVIFSQPKYVRASPNLAQMLQEKNPAADMQMSPVKIVGTGWGKGDGFILALRYHVPILNSLTHTWWEASTEPIFWRFTAEHYAFLIQMYHWVAWPLFLIYATARVVRGKQT